MATINDVATLAGVSRQSVSRVLNGKGYVGEATRERVNEAIKVLNYRPNMLAKALVTRHNRTLAYAMTNISDPFHNLVNQGFEAASFEKGYTSMMCDIHSAAREKDYINMFMDHCIGGVAFHHLAMKEEQLLELKKAGVCCVLLDNETEIPGFASVSTDNYQGGYMAGKYLASLGHRKIGCVHGIIDPTESHRNKENLPYEDTFQFNIWRRRTEGFLAAMREYGLSTEYMYQSHARYDYASEYTVKIVEKIFSGKERPSALYCENDIIAIAILKRLQEVGVRVPEDIAIMGHDGLDICQIILHPHLTTVSQPRYDMGYQVASMLIHEIENGKAAKSIVLQPTLQIGETT